MTPGVTRRMKSADKCKSCGAPIVWVRSVINKPIPLDPKIYRVVTEDGVVVKGRISHFATCPNADKFRRKS